MTTGERTSPGTCTTMSEITLLQIDSPAVVRNDGTIALPINSWLSAGFWDLFGLPRTDRVLAALTFGTESAPRTYLAGDRADTTTWQEAPLSVGVPRGLGPGPGLLEISGPMRRRQRRLIGRTMLVITIAAPVEYGSFPEHMWEEDRWHTTVLIPGTRPAPHSPIMRRFR